MKPSQTPARTADLAQRLAQRKAGGDHVGRGFVGHDDFEQFHDMGGREEVQADHVRGREVQAAISLTSR